MDIFGGVHYAVYHSHLSFLRKVLEDMFHKNKVLNKEKGNERSNIGEPYWIVKATSTESTIVCHALEGLSGRIKKII